MPTIKISQEHYKRLMAFKPVLEQILKQKMSDLEFADFVVFFVVEHLVPESAMSGDLQLIAAMRRGEGPLQAALDILENAQKTLQAISRRYPKEVFDVISGVWAGMEPAEQQDKGMGFHVLWERYKEERDPGNR